MAMATTTNQRLKCAVPLVTTTPFTMGMWVKPAIATSLTVWSMCAVASTAGYRVSSATSNAVFNYNDGTTDTGITITNGFSDLGFWHYVVARGISASNRKLAVLQGDTVLHGSSTATVTVVAGVQTSICSLWHNTTTARWEGSVAEFFYADADVQADGAQLDNAMLLQLAYQGPFSVPHLVPNIVEYRAMRLPQASDAIATVLDCPGESYQRGGQRLWQSNNGPTLDAHPPLSATYVRPNQNRRLLVV